MSNATRERRPTKQLHCKLTPPQLAKEWGVGPDKVVAFIHSGELRAINIASRLGGRPRYLIDRADVEAFERRREVVPVDKPLQRRMAKHDEKVMQFF